MYANRTYTSRMTVPVSAYVYSDRDSNNVRTYSSIYQYEDRTYAYLLVHELGSAGCAVLMRVFVFRLVPPLVVRVVVTVLVGLAHLQQRKILAFSCDRNNICI